MDNVKLKNQKILEGVKTNYEQKEFLNHIVENINNGDNAIDAVKRAGGQMRTNGFNKTQLIDWFCDQIKTSYEE